MRVGDKIKALRKAKKLTQEQLAEYLNVSSQAVSKWETGASSPDIDMLPRLAVFFQTSLDELFDFDRRKIAEEVDALVAQSVPLREEPEKAEAFYRRALGKYPNNEVLLNCLLMVIPPARSRERLRIGQRLLDCTTDDEIKYDVLRLLAQTYHGIGEDAMAEHCLAQMPELYFLKTEIAASIRRGDDRLREIRKTEDVCLGTLTAMLAMRCRDENDPQRAEEWDEFARRLFALLREHPEYRERGEKLAEKWDSGTFLEFYQ